MKTRSQFRLLSILRKEVESCLSDGYILIASEDYDTTELYVRRLIHNRNGNTLNLIADTSRLHIKYYKNHELIKTTNL